MASSWNGEFLAQFRLVTQNDTEQQQLLVFRVDETTFLVRHVLDVGGRERSFDREFDITRNSFVPHWILAPQPRLEWNVSLIYGRAASTVAYPLTLNDALELQSLFTGYKAVGSWFNVDCNATFDERYKIRATCYSGQGAVQLWEPTGRETQSGLNSPIATSIACSTTASAPTRLGGDLVSISQRENGPQVTISSLPHPTVLVAILRDKNDSYAVLKFNGKIAVDR
jgi:hypothetical protein